jgi:hypothetical protein
MAHFTRNILTINPDLGLLFPLARRRPNPRAEWEISLDRGSLPSNSSGV